MTKIKFKQTAVNKVSNKLHGNDIIHVTIVETFYSEPPISLVTQLTSLTPLVLISLPE